ncbi:hypothetical protein NHQ30_008037 [Ciborinia camelliae]|nr:hypothetical protein NHQ30_008037 [Ciborinia camelliae]
MYYSCECPHCDSGSNSSTYTSRAYTGTAGRYSNVNLEPITQQLHNAGRYTHMPSSRLGRSPYRDVGLLGSASCLGAVSGLSALGGMSGIGSLGALGGVRDFRDTRNYGGRYGLQSNRLGFRL